jgi:hypothetical protein
MVMILVGSAGFEAKVEFTVTSPHIRPPADEIKIPTKLSQFLDMFLRLMEDVCCLWCQQQATAMLCDKRVGVSRGYRIVGYQFIRQTDFQVGRDGPQ